MASNLYTTISKDLHIPDYNELCGALENGLKNNFAEATVCVEQCPDLTQKPWSLAAQGICGQTSLVDCGGVPYLVPTPDKTKIYNFDKIAECLDRKNAFIIGAGSGPFHRLNGQNSEMMANLTVGENENIQTRICTIENQNEWLLQKTKEKEFGLLGNFLVSHGKRDKVLKINVRKRVGKENFVRCIQSILKEKYPDQMIGIGGVFLIKTGKAQLHVMPCFSEIPLKTDEDVNNWLHFYEMTSPLVCLSVFYNQDAGLDLRIEHTHCFSHHGDGGHYHYDTTPDIVEYEAYFTVAERVYRIDRPTVTHSVGRD